jgi:hypothetical protein
MKKAHFQYVGYPRSGSTFLYRVFQQHNLLQECTNSFVKEFRCDNIDEYKSQYLKFDYSINMHASVLLLRNKQYICETDTVTDKFFACIRNPYEVVSSGYALWNGHPVSQPAISRIGDCVGNIKFFQDLISKPFRIFYFDDLVGNENVFVNEICEFLDIDVPNVNFDNILKHSSKEVYHDINTLGSTDVLNGKLTVRNQNEIVPEYNFGQQEIEYFNNKILELEQYLDRDFSHWKR